MDKLVEKIAEELWEQECGHIDTKWLLLDAVYKLLFQKRAKQILQAILSDPTIAQNLYLIVADHLAQFITEFYVDVRMPLLWAELTDEKKAFWYKEAERLRVGCPDLAIVEIDPDAELPPNQRVCNMRVIGEPEVTRQVQDEIRREIKIWDDAQQDMIDDGWVKPKEEK